MSRYEMAAALVGAFAGAALFTAVAVVIWNQCLDWWDDRRNRDA